MPHTLNIDGVSENAFDLQMLVHSSKSFCATHHVAWGEESPGEFDWEYYFGWLKSSLCEKLIRSAITLRMLQDILAADDMQESTDLENYQADSIDGIQLGTIHEGSFRLSLREMCNKIIHANDTQLDWHDDNGFQWWTGSVFLFGTKRGAEWKLELNVESFAMAANRYIDVVANNVDFHHLYKYDT